MERLTEHSFLYKFKIRYDRGDRESKWERRGIVADVILAKKHSMRL